MSWAIRDWLVWAEAFGLGELQLLPREFWRLTMREFHIMRDGFHRRENRAWEKTATLGLWILAPYSKQKLTPAELLGQQRLQTLPPTGTEPQNDADLERARKVAEALRWAREP